MGKLCEKEVINIATLLINGAAVEVRDAEHALAICEQELTEGKALLINDAQTVVRVIRSTAVRANPEMHRIDMLGRYSD